MSTDISRLLKEALRQLQTERDRVEQQIAAIEQIVNDTGQRRSLSPSARRAVSRRMKAYWAKRKATRKAKAAKG